MSFLFDAFKFAGEFGPGAVIALVFTLIVGLLVTVILMLVRSHAQVAKIEGNDLHSLETKLDSMTDVLQRIEVTLSWLKARANGSN